MCAFRSTRPKNVSRPRPPAAGVSLDTPPGPRLFERERQLQQGSLVAVAGRELDADRQAVGGGPVGSEMAGLPATLFSGVNAT